MSYLDAAERMHLVANAALRSAAPNASTAAASGVSPDSVGQYDLVIIGGGPIGLSTAWKAGQRGWKTLVLEQDSFCNDQGSSAGVTRQFRVQYAQKYMARMALASKTSWEALQTEYDRLLADRGAASIQLINKVGSLWFGSPDLATQEGGIDAAKKVMDELDIPYDPLETAADIETRFPYFKDLPANYTGFFQPDGGVINLKATQDALYRAAAATGCVTFRDYTKAVNLETMPNSGVRMKLVSAFDPDPSATASVTPPSTETVEALRVAVTAGPYTNDVLEPLSLKVPYYMWQMSSAYYPKTEAPGLDFAALPTWFVFQEPQLTNLFYGFPEVDYENPGYVRVAPDIPDTILYDVNKRTQGPSPKSLALNDTWVKDHMVGLDGSQPAYKSSCLISLSQSSNQELLLDYVPEHPNIVVYTAGWAAKFVPLMGDLFMQMFDAADAASGTGETPTVNLRLPGNQGVIRQRRFQIKWNWTPLSYETSPRFREGHHLGPQIKRVDVAAIGAGGASLYAAWRLKSHDPSRDVAIFEMSERIGGRLFSIQLPGTDVVSELGGMRYMTNQKIVTSLIENVFAKQFGLQWAPFPMGSPDQHLMYLRGQRFFASAWNQAKITGVPFKTRYYMPKAYEGMGADDMFTKIISDVLTADGYNLDAIQSSADPRREWDRVKQALRYRFDGPFKDMLVNDLGFWNLINDQAGQEAYEFLSAAGGYYSNTPNWNAAEAFPYMVGDFTADTVEYRTIEGGYDQTLTALATAFMEQKGEIWVQNRMETFERLADIVAKERAHGGALDVDEPPYTPASALHARSSSAAEALADGYKYRVQFFDIKNQERWFVYAKDIFLGMPLRALEQLDQDNFFFDRDLQPELQHQMDSVIMEPSYKILLEFPYNWWTATLGATAGESITDLPIRQAYFFQTDPKTGHAMMLASYNDMRAQEYWSALEPPVDFDGQAIPHEHGMLSTPSGQDEDSESSNGDGVGKLARRVLKLLPLGEGRRDSSSSTGAAKKAPGAILRSIGRGAKILRTHQRHGNTARPDFVNPTYNVPPRVMVDEVLSQLKQLYGPELHIPYPIAGAFQNWSQGGYHGWRPKYQVWETMPYMRQPDAKERVFIAGSAYSDQQGWVEGAFCTAEHILREKFGLPVPDWLPADYYLGN